MKKWSLQLRRSFPDGIPASSNGNSMQQQEMSLMQERALPSSPSPLYSHSKASAFMKGGIGQPSSRKQLMGGHAVLDNSKGLLQWVQSISFVSVSIDHSLQLVFQADSTSPGTRWLTLTVFATFLFKHSSHFLSSWLAFKCICNITFFWLAKTWSMS